MNKWEITDNEMEGFVKSLFKDEEKYQNALDNACDLQYDSAVREVFLENTNFKDSYYGNYFKVGIPKKRFNELTITQIPCMLGGTRSIVMHSRE